MKWVAVSIVPVLALWGLAAFLFPTLPERIPVHFNLEGMPDRFDDRSSFWILPAVATMVSLVLLGANWLVGYTSGRHPRIVNVPDKEAFLTLSPEARLAVMRPVRLFLVLMNAVVLAVLAWSMVDMQRVATGQADAIFPYSFVAILLMALIGVPWLILSTRRGIEAAQVRSPP